jgi:glycosyltransferase involved in cell wall biosynthesis
MTERKRLAICYAAPGLNLLSSAGPTRNVLSVADALSEWADVTVAFRAILEPIERTRFRVVAMDAAPAPSNGNYDDNGTRGLQPLRHLAYCRTLSTFARERANAFDVVLEKGWRLSGLLAAAFQRAGVSAALVENDVRLWTEPVRGVVGLSKYVAHCAADRVARSSCRHVPMVIAETEELKARLVAHRGIPPERIRVIGLGVDHSLFRPMDQAAARRHLGLRTEPTILLYVGAMDEYHDLEPVIDALAKVGDPAIELHVVGGGEFRERYEARAAQARIVSRFHGRVAHAMVPHYITAADLCIAPYRTHAFHGGVVTFSTLKIPEYMACGRAAAGVPSPAIRQLIQDGVNGFVLPNDVGSWTSFLRALPPRERLGAMGAAAARAVSSLGWDNTARRYLEVCEQLVPC